MLMSAWCRVPACGWRTGEPVKDIAGYLATWHVYERHPEIRAQVAGGRFPADPDPRKPEVRQVLAARLGSS